MKIAEMQAANSKTISVKYDKYDWTVAHSKVLKKS
jgi:hypothetical protein